MDATLLLRFDDAFAEQIQNADPSEHKSKQEIEVKHARHLPELD